MEDKEIGNIKRNVINYINLSQIICIYTFTTNYTIVYLNVEEKYNI